jgi:hypothetical protein
MKSFIIHHSANTKYEMINRSVFGSGGGGVAAATTATTNRPRVAISLGGSGHSCTKSCSAFPCQTRHIFSVYLTGAHVTWTPAARDSEPTTAPYLCIRSMSQVAAKEIGDGKIVSAAGTAARLTTRSRQCECTYGGVRGGAG